VQVPAPGTDKWLNKPIWDAEIVGPSALARVGAAFANPNNPSRMILFLDPRKYIKAVGEISPNIDSKKFAEEVRKFAIANGASSAVAYGSFESDAVMFEQLVRDGILDDAFIPGFGGLRDAMMRPPRLFETPPREASEDQLVTSPDEKLRFTPNVNAQIDTPEFKRWFGNSKVVDAKGLPLVVYHGSPDVSQLTAFSKETLGMTTGSKSATRGFFFVDKHSVASQYAGMMNESQRVAAEKLDAQIERLDAARYDARTPEEYQKAEARYQSAVAKQMPLVPEASRAGVHWTDMFGREHQMRYGQGSGVLAVYLSLKNPMIVEQQNASFRDQTYDDLLKEAKRKRHDGLIIRNTDDAPFGGVAPQTIYVAFRPEQIKSAYGNRGTFDPADPDIRFRTSASARRSIGTWWPCTTPPRKASALP